jgi:mono/diheme cytochrome c family protein
VFLLGAALLALAACAKPRGEQLFLQSGCPRCHGPDRQGTKDAPPLQSLRYVWTAEQLVAYLADPPAYIKKDPRLQELAAKYKTPMPSFASLDEPARRELAGWLLRVTR